MMREGQTGINADSRRIGLPARLHHKGMAGIAEPKGVLPFHFVKRQKLVPFAPCGVYYIRKRTRIIG